MVDKVIGELPAISSLDATSLFVAEQSGQAVKVTGKQLTDFSNVETTAQVEQAKASAQAAKTAQDAAEAAILKSPIIQNGTWWVYNQTAGAYQDTGINATGPQGIPGPTASVNGISPDGSGNITLSAGDVSAYSKTETDTLLSNKAPAGYGLGGSYGGYIADADNATVDGKYKTNSGTLNLPDGVDGMFGVIDVTTTRPDKALLQKFCPGTDGYPPYSLERRCIVGRWKPWEWVHPPMVVGTEYRTTERYQGKPVYTKLVNCGSLPSSERKQVSHSISNIENVIRCVGQRSNGDSIPSKYAESDYSSIFAGTHSIYIYVGTDMSATTANAQLWYTKTTD